MPQPENPVLYRTMSLKSWRRANPQLSIVLPRHAYSGLAGLAQRRHVTAASYVRSLLLKHLDALDALEPPPGPLSPEGLAVVAVVPPAPAGEPAFPPMTVAAGKPVSEPQELTPDLPDVATAIAELSEDDCPWGEP